jgi:hypothetical protein
LPEKSKTVICFAVTIRRSLGDILAVESGHEASLPVSSAKTSHPQP